MNWPDDLAAPAEVNSPRSRAGRTRLDRRGRLQYGPSRDGMQSGGPGEGVLVNDMTTPVSIGVMALTVVISAVGFFRPPAARELAESPWAIVHRGTWYQLFTSGFLHADLGHLLMNMFTLFFFGPFVERILGGEGFLVLYLGSMLAGGLLTLATHYNHRQYRAVGASGAISGVLFSFVLFRPFAPIYIFFLPVGIPAVLFALLYVVVSLVGMRARLGRIGHEAHLGGAIGGIILTVILHPDAWRTFLSHFR
jgi:membrane associated rhomboid family serine protease